MGGKSFDPFTDRPAPTAGSSFDDASNYAAHQVFTGMLRNAGKDPSQFGFGGAPTSSTQTSEQTPPPVATDQVPAAPSADSTGASTVTPTPQPLPQVLTGLGDQLISGLGRNNPSNFVNNALRPRTSQTALRGQV